MPRRQPCKDCGRRPKLKGRHRCATCWLRVQPIGEQVAAARRRLAMVPPELRVKRGARIRTTVKGRVVKGPVIDTLAPAGTAWCAGCQTFRDEEDFGKGATKCRACSSAKQHGAMIEKTYGLTAEQYDALLERQGGRCAICRNRPKSKRLAVDHDHKTGEVRGLLCSRCNHDLMGSAWDSLALAAALWHYMNTPPASGAWLPPEDAPPLAAQATRATPDEAIVATRAERPRTGRTAPPADECARTHYLPAGSESDPDRGPGYFRLWREAGAELPPF